MEGWKREIELTVLMLCYRVTRRSPERTHATSMEDRSGRSEPAVTGGTKGDVKTNRRSQVYKAWWTGSGESSVNSWIVRTTPKLQPYKS